MNAREIWHATLGELQLQMTKATFDTWVRPTNALAYEDGTLIVGVHSPYAREWLENRLQTTIQRTVTGIIGRSVEVRYVVKEQASSRDRNAALSGGATDVALLRALNTAPSDNANAREEDEVS